MPSACNEIIDDIEDLVSTVEVRDDGEGRRSGVTVRRRALRRNAALSRISTTQDKDGIMQDGDVSLQDAPTSVVPGTQSVYIKTWGCTHNTSDTEYMAGLLSSYGYTLTEDKEAADLWLLNSCTVKNPAEDHFRNEVEGGRKRRKPVVVAGCVPQGAPKSHYLRGLSVVGVHHIDRIVEVVEQTLNGNSVRLVGPRKGGVGGGLSLPKVRRNPLVEIIAISTGCLNQCTYCKTKHARGHLGSYPPDEIVERARQAFSEGVVELWITSEDTGAYGRDIGTSLPELMWRLIDVVPRGCMMRLGMTNPPYILDHAEEMVKILSHERVYSFIHIPVQSGSDAVLKEMKREYTRSDFESLVSYLVDNVNGGVTVATDIICGFPTETEEDFDETLSLCQRFKFPSLFINQYYPRPGTPAARLPRLPHHQVKGRTKKLSTLLGSYEPLSGLEGTEWDVLVTERSSDGKHLVGHNKLYQQVLIDREDEDLMGKVARVRIATTSRFSMLGEVISPLPSPPCPAPVSPPVLRRTPLPLDCRPSLSPAVLFVAILLLARFCWSAFI